jgi:hypothetical protein
MDKNKNGYRYIEETWYRWVGSIMNNFSAHGGNGSCAKLMAWDKIDGMGVHEKEDSI